jgi:hypothetical protein
MIIAPEGKTVGTPVYLIVFNVRYGGMLLPEAHETELGIGCTW